MTEAEKTGRRPFTWSIDAWGNRFAYSFVVLLVAAFAFDNKPLAVSIAVAFFLLLIGISYFRRWGQAGTDRQR